MVSSVSADGIIASYSGITQDICFKSDGKTIRAEVWDKSSGKLLATIDNLFIEALSSKTPQETLSWMLKNHYAFTWNHAQIAYHPTLRGGNNNQLLNQLNDPDLITALFKDPERAQSYVKAIQEDPTLKSQLFNLVLASRTDPTQAVRAANSISLLNAARIPFSRMDLSGINIPGAHLWGAILDGTILDEANLTDVILINAFLGKCSLIGANMKGVQFGERAYLEHPNSISCITFSPVDGKILATAGVWDKKIWLWKEAIDPKTGEKAFHFFATLEGHIHPIYCLAFSPDGKILASGEYERVYLWEESIDPKIGEKPFLLIATLEGHTKQINTLAFSPKERIFATGSNDKTVRLWHEVTDPQTEKKTFQQFRVLKGHTRWVMCVAFSQDGEFLATGGIDDFVLIWKKGINPKTGEKTFQHFSTIDEVWEMGMTLVFSPDGEILATGNNNNIILWKKTSNPKKKKIFRFFRSLDSEASTLAFSHDGKILAVGGYNTVDLWEEAIDPKKEEKIFRYWQTDSLSFDALTVAFSPNEEILAIGGKDKTVRLWEGTTFKPLINFNRFFGKILTLEFSPDGEILRTACSIYAVCQRRIGPKIGKKAFGGFIMLGGYVLHHRPRHSVLSPNRKTLATYDGSFIDLWKKVLDPEAEREIFQHFFSLDRCWTDLLAFSPNGKILAVRDKSTVSLWEEVINPKTNKMTSQQVFVFEGFKVRTLAFSPKGKILATGGRDQTVRLWEEMIDPETKKKSFQLICVLEGQHSNLTALAFSPKGNILATEGEDQTVRLWEETIDPKTSKTSFQLFCVLEEQTKVIRTIAFSSDGKILAVGGDNSVNLWKEAINPKTGKKTFQQIACLKGYINSVRTIAFSSDGKILAIESEDSTIKSWKLFNQKGVFDPCLVFVSNPNSLFVKGARIDEVQGLSPKNYALLMQRGVLESSIPPALEDYAALPSDPLSSEKVLGKKPITEERRKPTSLTELEDTIKNLLDWIDQQSTKRSFDSEPAEVNHYIKKLRGFAGECQKSPPKDEAKLQVTIKYFKDQLKAFQARYESSHKGNTSSLLLLPFPNFENLQSDANQPPKTQRPQPSASEDSMQQPPKLTARTNDPSSSERKKRRNVGTVRRFEAKNSPVQMEKLQKEIESVIDQRECTHQNEIQRVSQRVQALEERSEETQESLKEIIHEEASSLSTEIEKIQKVLKDLETWKMAEESYEKESEASKEELLRVEQLIAQTRKLYQQELKRLQEQQQLLSDHHAIQEDKLKPLYEKYLRKEKILKEQERLMSLDQVHAFYKALEKNLGSKFQASILLTSNLIQRKAVKKDLLAEGAEYAIEGVFGFVAGVISVSTLGVSTIVVGAAAAVAGVATGKAAAEVIGGQIDKKYEDRAKEVSAIMSNPKHAWGVAELVARGVSNHYFMELQGTTPQQNREWGEEAAGIIYRFIASGELKKQSFKTEDEMIKVLLKVIQDHIEAEEKKKNTTSKKRCEIL